MANLVKKTVQAKECIKDQNQYGGIQIISDCVTSFSQTCNLRECAFIISQLLWVSHLVAQGWSQAHKQTVARAGVLSECSAGE